MDSKIDLRIIAKEIRKNLDIERVSNQAVSKIRELEVYKNARNVLIFYPMKYEINVLELLNDDKNFYLPRVCGNLLSVCPFKSGDKLIKSDLNVCEPCSNAISPETLDLIIVPALMADDNNYRLGYGGGVYDRFLAEYREIATVLPIAKELCIKNLPYESLDIQIGTVIKC